MILCCEHVQVIDWNTFIPILTACLTILGSVIVWALSERSKRRQEIYKRKEERYAKLIESLKGFYVNNQDKTLKDAFLTQINLSWMYCPDIVIQKAYEFIHMVHTHSDRKYSDDEKEKAVGELILEIRKDLMHNKELKKTLLKPEDFKHLSAT